MTAVFEFMWSGIMNIFDWSETTIFSKLSETSNQSWEPFEKKRSMLEGEEMEVDDKADETWEEESLGESAIIN